MEDIISTLKVRGMYENKYNTPRIDNNEIAILVESIMKDAAFIDNAKVFYQKIFHLFIGND